jgi:hypothetical protein
MSPAAVLLASALMATPASRLVEARQLADEFQYDKALKLAEATLLQPDLSHETLVGLYELVGTAAATLDRAAKARDAFQLLLLVEPQHQLSKDLPPRVRTPYFEARAQAARLGPLSLKPEPVVRVDGLVKSVAVTVRDLPALPARAVRFRLAVDDAPERVETVPLPPSRRVQVAVVGKAVRWTAELLGERGAVLLQVSREELPPPPPVVVAPPPPPPPPPPVVPPPPAKPAWLLPLGIVVGSVGVAALGAGGGFGYFSRSARDKLSNATRDGQGVIVGLTQRDAAALDAQARSFALVADVLFIGGGALAVAGVPLIIVGALPGTPDARAGAPSLTLLLGPTGFGLAGQF